MPPSNVLSITDPKIHSQFNDFCLFVTGIDKILRAIFVFGVTFSAKTAKMWLAQSLQNTLRNFLLNHHLKHK
jgi:hypothetical protein